MTGYEHIVVRIRGALAGRRGVTEKKMFGGVCFMLRGHMLCGASKRGFMFRVGRELESAALARPGTKVMQMGGRRYHGFLRVDPVRCKGRDLKALITLAERHVASLPARKARRPRKQAG